MKDCIFCKIIAGEIPSKKVFEDDMCYAFYDISPQAKVHVLVVSKVHVENIILATEKYSEHVNACLSACSKIAKQLGLDQSGFRIVTNCGVDGCQSVNHLHFHILGGEKLSGQMA